jgi:hypothetical protein
MKFADLSPRSSARACDLGGVVKRSPPIRDDGAGGLGGKVTVWFGAHAGQPFGRPVRACSLQPGDDQADAVFRQFVGAGSIPASFRYLEYKVKQRQLSGENKFIVNKLKLGERVDSPDAIKLPLDLAIALLEDSKGIIDLDLGVRQLDDPQFSYGKIIWKAIVNVLTKLVTAPFRALGKLLGVSSEKLEAVDFDPGSSTLLPPEQEKLRHCRGLGQAAGADPHRGAGATIGRRPARPAGLPYKNGRRRGHQPFPDRRPVSGCESLQDPDTEDRYVDGSASQIPTLRANYKTRMRAPHPASSTANSSKGSAASSRPAIPVRLRLPCRTAGHLTRQTKIDDAALIELHGRAARPCAMPFSNWASTTAASASPPPSRPPRTSWSPAGKTWAWRVNRCEPAPPRQRPEACSSGPA